MDNTSTVDSDGDGFSGNQYADCARIVPLLNRLHWSTMNWNYGGRAGANALAYTTWENQGCTEEIQKRLGYRFRLTQAVLPTTLQAGGTLQASFDVRNDGFATPYNPRGLELIVRNKATLATAAVIPLCDGRSKPSNPAYDPRFWQSGKTTTLAVSTTLPATLAAGDYEVLIHLFDPLLYGRPEFSIRLANQNMWEATTGYNKLDNTLTITGAGTTLTPTTPTTGVADGIYTLTARHSGKLLDVSGISLADGAAVHQWDAWGGANQQWRVTATGSGYYKLTAQHSGKVLEVAAGSPDNGAQVQQGTDNGSSAQRWKIEPTSGGFSKLTAQSSGKALDVEGGPDATVNGVRVQQWAYAGSLNQQWKLTLVANGTATVLAARSTAEAAVSLSVYPNPSPDGRPTLRLSAPTAQKATVLVVDALGRTRARLEQSVLAGSTDVTLPAKLPAGLYFLQTTLNGRALHTTLHVE